MRAVARYRAWALRGPFLLHHDHGVVEVSWPPADTLLSYDDRESQLFRLARLAGDSAPDLLQVIGVEDFVVFDLILDDLAEYFGCSRARRAVSLMDRYGDSIASDFWQVYQVDMLGVFRGDLLPDEVVDRIEGLPRYSRLSEALAQDDELAANTPDSDDDDDPAPQHPRFTEWTPEAERLASVIDRLGDIISAIASLAGSQTSIPLQPRPVGAAKRLRDEQSDTDYEDLLHDVAVAHARHEAASQTP